MKKLIEDFLVKFSCGNVCFKHIKDKITKDLVIVNNYIYSNFTGHLFLLGYKNIRIGNKKYDFMPSLGFIDYLYQNCNKKVKNKAKTLELTEKESRNTRNKAKKHCDKKHCNQAKLIIYIKDKCMACEVILSGEEEQNFIFGKNINLCFNDNYLIKVIKEIKKDLYCFVLNSYHEIIGLGKITIDKNKGARALLINIYNIGLLIKREIKLK